MRQEITYGSRPTPSIHSMALLALALLFGAAGLQAQPPAGYYDSVDATTPEARGNDIQGSVGDPALEHISPVCDSVNDLDYLSIARFGDPAPDGPDTLQILGNFTPMEEWTNASSATGPGADSANPGALTVGATLRPSSLVLADYSSQGPTLDARVGVDLIAASCLPVDNFPGCFTGTSASAPLVTGTLAVLRDAGVFDAATTVHSVIPDIVLDQGANGPDVAYGTGSFRLPPPIDFGIVPVDELCFGLAPTITGTDDADIINGTPGDDIIRAGAGDDLIFGGGGHDVICGEDGRDTIYGGRGRDHIDGGDRRDRIWGEAGADTIMGGLGLDRIVGNLGNDVIHGLGNHDLIKGGPGDDTIRGGSGDDRIEGGDGGDTINGGNGTDACVGSGPGLPADPGDVMSRCE